MSGDLDLSRDLDLLRELGPLAMGSRLRRLTERLMADGARVYREQGLDFEPRWFPLVYLLSERAPLSVNEAAAALGVSHAAVSQIVKDLQRRRLVSSTRDPRDERRRRLRLTAAARRLLPVLLPVWNDFEAATSGLLAEADGDGDADLLRAVSGIEHAHAERPFADRVLALARSRADAPVEIVEYEPAYRADFERLNRAWLERDFYVEELDRQVLENPQREILDGGGALFFARCGTAIVGCCGLQWRGQDQLELMKMAVETRFQGRGIGGHLTRTAVRRARALGAEKLVLESNSRLQPALHLYRKLGFEERTSQAPLHDRADVWMELDLRADGASAAPAARIEAFRAEQTSQVTHLILGIQAGEFSIPITAADQPDLADIEAAYQKSGCFFVAVDGQRVVGTIGLMRFSPHQGAILKMFVDREYRGPNHRIAARLLAALLAWCRREGVDTLALGTIAILHAAHRFYEKSGFERIDPAELPEKFPRMELDDVFYRLRLSDAR